MNRLPYETWLDILSRLGFSDKLQCPLTCRDWSTKISSSVLYAKIRLIFQDDINALLERLRDQDLGRQIVDLSLKKLNDPIVLSNLCPNLKSLKLHNSNYHKYWKDANNTVLAQNWSNLEAIVETRYGAEGFCPPKYLTMKLLDAPFPMMSLTSLAFDFNEIKDALSNFVRLVKHAPALEYLQLLQVEDVSPGMLDLLHKNTPNSKDLDLFHPLLTDEEYEGG